jgi:hypothetical protein
MTEAEKTWTERVAEWRASGRPAPEFVQGRGYAASTLRYWATRLQRLAEGRPWPSSSRVRMARVKVTKASSAPLVVAVGAARIEVRPGFDGALLREVIAAIGGGAG